MTQSTPLQIDQYDHIKVATKDIPGFINHLEVLGFSRHRDEGPEFLQKPEAIYGSGKAVFCLYPTDHPMAKKHYELHGDTIFDLSFTLPDSKDHKPFEIEGVGAMRHTITDKPSFEDFPVKRGITRFDHNTLNVDMGKLEPTVCEYLSMFALERGQFFNIHTDLTGLNSWVTRSPSYGVQIPFNEATERESQVQEYIDLHKGPGVQHIALLSDDILQTMEEIKANEQNKLEFLDIPDTYYELAEKRVKIDEDLSALAKQRVLVDQDDKGGYLLQIFTKNIFGGFFFELIQRKGNTGFGEGNFQALFESIELDQKRRGVL